MSPISRLALVTLVAFTAALGSLEAQSVKAPNNPSAVVGGGLGAPSDPIPVGPRLDFYFDKLPLEQVIRQVQATYHKESGEYLNVMVPENLREVSETNLITVEIKQVTVSELFNLLSRASQRTVAATITAISNSTFRRPEFVEGYRFEPMSATGGPLTYLLLGEYAPEVIRQNPLPGDRDYLIIPPPLPPPPPPPVEPKTIQYFQLDPYLERFTVDDITTAIKTGWDMAGYKPAPAMKYHEETKLLVFYGTEPEMTVIKGVLEGIASARGSEGVGGGIPPAPPRPLLPRVNRIPTQSPPVLPPPPANP